MKNWLIGFSVFLLVGGFIIGKIEMSASKASAPASLVANPLFKSLDLPQLKEIYSKHKLTLVNMWASWCGPCKAEIPELVELRRRHADKGLEVVLMSVDQPKDRIDANGFLMEQKIDFLTYFAAEPVNETMEAVSGGWEGAIPASFLFNSAGEKVDSWQGAGNIEDFEAKILPLLAK